MTNTEDQMNEPTVNAHRGTNNRIASMKRDWVMPDLGEAWPYEITYLPNGWGVSIAEINADLAGRMLETNVENNRDKKKSLIVRYTMDMQQERWKLTHQGIAFNRLGRLHDGQNRLYACVASDDVFRSLVWFGVGEEDEMAVFDTGAPRRAVDAARILMIDKVNHQDIATMRGFLFGPDTERPVFTNSFLLDQLEKYQSMVLFVRTFPKSPYLLGPNRAALGRAFYHTEPDRILRFANVVADNLPATDPGDLSAVLVRRFIAGNKASVGGGGLSRDLYCRTQRAVQGFLDGQNLSKLYPCTDDLFPLPNDEQIAARNHE